MATATAVRSDSLLIDIHEMVSLLNLSIATIHRRAAAGLLPAPVLGDERSKKMWSRRQVEQWVANGCPPCREVSHAG
jgi:predicted DNA-binding transcriptional regulator AlpA